MMNSEDQHGDDVHDRSPQGDGQDDDQRTGPSRREVMRRGAIIGGAAMWAVPTVQTIGMPGASAGTPLDCTGFAYNVKLEGTGLVAGTVGPLNKSPKDQHFDEQCVAELDADLDGTDPPEVLVGVACVENDFGDTCCTRSTLTRTAVDLNDLGIDVLLNAETIFAEACASCEKEPEATVSLVDARIVVLGTTTNLESSPGPNTSVADLSVAGSLNVSLVLNEQGPITDGIEVNAIHLRVELLDLDGNVVQTVDLILGHAEADVHNCEE